MLVKLNHWLYEQWRQLFNTFWFIPGIVSFIGPLLAICCIAIDKSIKKGALQGPYLFHGGISAASALLSTVAGSLITVAGLAFSVTIVALQLVSSQYTPRALRGFLQDRIIQFVAGGFFAIFSYALIVLSTVREAGPSSPEFIPELSITVAIILGLLGLALLLLFIHHTGRIIQVADIAARIAAQTLQATNLEYFPKSSEVQIRDVTGQIESLHTQGPPERIFAQRIGYVQRINLSHLVADIMRPGVHLRLLVCPGDFVSTESAIAEIWPIEAADVKSREAIHQHVSIERERDIDYDAKFGVRQLADIALRALSPAVNDPTTGVLCIKYLQTIFEHLAHQLPPRTIYHFEQGRSTLIIRQPAFQAYLKMYVEIGYYAGENVRIVNTLLRALTSVAQIISLLDMPERSDVLRFVSSNIVAHALRNVLDESDRIHIHEQLDEILSILDAKVQKDPEPV
jgi:uncharacterized membrane protein